MISISSLLVRQFTCFASESYYFPAEKTFGFLKVAKILAACGLTRLRQDFFLTRGKRSLESGFRAWRTGYSVLALQMSSRIKDRRPLSDYNLKLWILHCLRAPTGVKNEWWSACLAASTRL